MSSNFESLFSRIEYIIDKYYGGNKSKFGRDAGISGQYVGKWEKKFKEEGEEPNPTFKVIENIVTKTPVNPIWLLTGLGSPERKEEAVIDRADEVDDALLKYLYHRSTQGSSSNDRVLLIEYLRERAEDLARGLDLLRRLESNQ